MRRKKVGCLHASRQADRREWIKRAFCFLILHTDRMTTAFVTQSLGTDVKTLTNVAEWFPCKNSFLAFLGNACFLELHILRKIG